MDFDIIKPKMLTEGSKIAVVSPSWGGPFHFPWLLDKAIENIQSLFGVEVIEYPTARMDSRLLYLNPKLRADDINNAFNDDSVDAIFVTIGGNDSIRILEYLDINAIIDKPKILLGFSDTTTLLTYLNTKGLVTFHGPSMMAGWAQAHHFIELHNYYKHSLMSNVGTDELPIFPMWSNGYPDWSILKNTGEVNPLMENKGPRWLQGSEVAVGRLWGGCIEVLDLLNGTKYWPKPDFWNDRILMIETSEDKPSPEQVGFWLRNYGIQDILKNIQGLLIGRPKDYTNEECKQLDDMVLNIVGNEFGCKNIPIISNLSFGHTDPNLIMPLGINFKLNPMKKAICRIEEVFQ